MSKVSSEKAVEPLIEALKDPDYDVQSKAKAAEALGKIGSDKAVQPLIEAFQDPNLRRQASEALIKIGNVMASELISNTLIARLKDPNIKLRNEAAEALVKIGSKKAVESLILDLKDPTDHVRRQAAESLVTIVSDKAIESLILTLEDSNVYTSIFAAKALDKIAKVTCNLPTLAQQLPHLLTLIPTESSQQALSVITVIQARCKYYNYNIAQTPLPPENNPNPTTGNTFIFNDKVGQVVAGNLTVQRDNIATQNNQKTAPES
ncbi:hypothetical protein APA_1173 [Pseudanabaena sp. lw0831]|nr:hypothetical protein APA_1173 [Pseudanabaena sp. lw0831]